ncbi:MAG: glycosyltransferase [Anaerolineae bacterium]|nr:glycosyltransferase [Anaerolineae bacterium]
MTPLVTFITATYNGADYLRETIDSILAQTYPNIEYIVLDDGSSDNTIEILKSYRERIKWESHSNMGECRTINKGYSMAKGDYIIAVSADDPMKSNLAEISVQVMEAHPDALVGYPDWDNIDFHGNVIKNFKLLDYDYNIMLRMHFNIPNAGTIIRRRALELETGRDPQFRFVHDYEFYLRVGLHGPFVHIPHTLATWRSHPGSTSVNSRNAKMAAEDVACVEKLYERTDLSEAVKKARPEALSTAYYIAGLILMPNFELARPYFLQSIKHYPLAPHAYPTGLLRSRKYLLCALFPFLRRFLL